MMKRKTEVRVVIPDKLLHYTNAAEIIETTRLQFRGRTFTLREILIAISPILEDIENAADYVRSEEQLTGHRMGNVQNIEDDE